MEPNSTSEQQKAVELARMKRTATGLLVLMTLIYIVSRVFHGEFVWLGFVEATAEAAMVGALASSIFSPRMLSPTRFGP